MSDYNHNKIEKKWQERWIDAGAYEPDLDASKKPFYNLMMFPYPSGEGLHVGHAFAFSGADTYGRFQRMCGSQVFQPIGFDSFGIHSENYALKVNENPRDLTKKTTTRYEGQLKSLGISYAWRETLFTSDPEYYSWTQWIFIQMFKAGLAYRKKASVNWCTKCLTVLADEQVISGKCERCGSDVEKKALEQWFFKITDYADRLLEGLNEIDWPEKIKIAQRNWIGKSEGALLKFPISNSQYSIEVFTTRPDTLFGATYIVLSPEHPLLEKNQLSISNKEAVQKYISYSRKKTDEERIASKEKTGVGIKGVYAINPATKKEIPIWVADYVLSGYGTGAIMAVPAHDERDYEFASNFSLPIIKVIEGEGECWAGEGKLMSSGEYSGMNSEKAKWEITKYVAGKRQIQYRIRDWLISRQRYWGPPIPLIFCEQCAETVKSGERKAKSRGESENPGWFPAPEKDLPILLPDIKDFRPTGTDKAPLANLPEFYETRCPECGKDAKRETDVSDTFLDSAWYYLGYLTLAGKKKGTKNPKFIPDTSRIKKWLPVNMYIGGSEHAVLHLLYVRFISMVMHDLGITDFAEKTGGEPIARFRAHGLLIKDGAKMSKSRGNVVNPDEYVRVYGADAFRMYLMFLGPFEQGGDFQDAGIRGLTRFLNRVWALAHGIQNRSITSKEIEGTMQKTVRKVTIDIENLQYNTAVSSLMIMLSELEKSPESFSKETFIIFLKLLAPFAPHMTEELYELFNGRGSIHLSEWPQYNPDLIIENSIELVIQVNGKVRDTKQVSPQISEADAREVALASERVEKLLSGKTPKKVIFVPGKLINIVVDL